MLFHLSQRTDFTVALWNSCRAETEYPVIDNDCNNKLRQTIYPSLLHMYYDHSFHFLEKQLFVFVQVVFQILTSTLFLPRLG